MVLGTKQVAAAQVRSSTRKTQRGVQPPLKHFPLNEITPVGPKPSRFSKGLLGVYLLKPARLGVRVSWPTVVMGLPPGQEVSVRFAGSA